MPTLQANKTDMLKATLWKGGRTLVPLRADFWQALDRGLFLLCGRAGGWWLGWTMCPLLTLASCPAPVCSMEAQGSQQQLV